jgi:putative chitinase
MRYFVAQTFFETLSYTAFAENLYYTKAAQLVAVWPSRFTCDQNACTATIAYAPDYVCNAQKLANFVYCNRNGNGNLASNDGYNFRGRGGLQNTGRANYLAYSLAQYGDDRCVKNPDMLSQPEDAFESAGWFWTTHGLNALADTDSFTLVTKNINGSTVTVPDRIKVLNTVNSVLQW